MGLIYCSDFETATANTEYYKINNDTKVLLAASIDWDGNTSLFSSIEEWFNFHLKVKKTHVIYFHNLSWDGDFILKYLVNHTKFRYDNGEKVMKDNSFKVFRQGSRIYYIRLYVRYQENNVRYKFFIDIKCSYRLLNCSIEALGKSLGILKHQDNEDASFYDIEPEDDYHNYPSRFLEYIKNDVTIALMSLKNFEKSILGISTIKRLNDKLLKRRKKGVNCFHKLTSASTTKWLMKSFCAFYNFVNRTKLKLLYIPSKAHEEAQKWFKGGFTQINEKYIGNLQDVGIGLMIDVSSAYPYQMTFPLPYGDLLDSPPKEGTYAKFLAIKVVSAKIKKGCEDCVCLYNWDKKSSDLRYQKSLKNFTCYYIEEEWEALQKFYDFKVEYTEVFYVKTAPFLKEYAEELYAIKDHYDKTKQSGLKQSAKILLNAGYGCLAMRQEYTNFIYMEKDEVDLLNLKEDDYFSIDKRTYKFKKFNDNFNFCKDRLVLIEAIQEKEKKMGVNKLAAAYITGRQRAYLLNKINEYGAKHFALCDTDSILLVNLSEKLKQKIMKDVSHGLGAWEIENKDCNIRYFGTYGAKKYVMEDDNHNLVKLRFAGISENTSHISKIYEDIDFDAEEIEIKDAIYVRKFEKSGIVLIKKDKIISKGTL